MIVQVLSILNLSWKWEFVRDAYPNAPGWCFYLLIVSRVLTIICLIALFRWKQWGFWGFFGSVGLLFFTVVAAGGGIFRGLCGWLLSTAVLFAFLQIGRDKKGWTQLE